MDNLELAKIFSDIADILEIKGENLFKVRAYRRVVQVLESLPQDINEIYQEGGLNEIPGVGEGIAKKIQEIMETGKLKYYEDLRSTLPPGVLEILRIPEVGPKTVALLYEKLGIDSVDKLEEAAREGKVRLLPGMGAKTEENILKGISLMRRRSERIPLGEALTIAEGILKHLRSLPEVKRISPAGSLRRRRETIGDIDILVSSSSPERIMDTFTTLPQVKEVLAKGETKSSVLIGEGRQVDVRVVPQESFGAALHYFTGSKSHNIRIRELGVKKGLKINEYGVFRRLSGDKEERIGGEEEEEVFQSVGLPYIPPELREDSGEIEAALEGRLPHLVELRDIKGDLHVHSKWSDGAHTLRQIAEAAISCGYQYIGVCDHSRSLKVAGGLEIEELEKKKEEIEALNREFAPFRLLYGTEVDILSDGSLDYPDEVLEEFDLVIAAIHSGFRQDREAMTRRIIRALENQHVDILAHPTGRILGSREAYSIDIEEVIRTASSTGTILEINAFPDRLDLRDTHARLAKEKGVKLAISTDAHNVMQLEWMSFGVDVARRGWLEPKHIANSLSQKELLKLLKGT